MVQRHPARPDHGPGVGQQDGRRRLEEEEGLCGPRGGELGDVVAVVGGLVSSRGRGLRGEDEERWRGRSSNMMACSAAGAAVAGRRRRELCGSDLRIVAADADDLAAVLLNCGDRSHYGATSSIDDLASFGGTVSSSGEAGPSEGLSPVVWPGTMVKSGSKTRSLGAGCGGAIDNHQNKAGSTE